MNTSLSPKEVAAHFLDKAEKRTDKAYAVKYGDDFLYLGGRKTWQTIGAAKGAISHMIRNHLYSFFSPEARELRINKKLAREVSEELLRNHLKIVEI